MSARAEYVSGWIDTTIHEFLQTIEEPASSMANAFITCVDSSFDIASILEQSRHLNILQGKCKTVGQGVLLTTRQLLAAQRQQRLFFGFDEIWFFPKAEI